MPCSHSTFLGQTPKIWSGCSFMSIKEQVLVSQQNLLQNWHQQLFHCSMECATISTKKRGKRGRKASYRKLFLQRKNNCRYAQEKMLLHCSKRPLDTVRWVPTHSEDVEEIQLGEDFNANLPGLQRIHKLNCSYPLKFAVLWILWGLQPSNEYAGEKCVLQKYLYCWKYHMKMLCIRGNGFAQMCMLGKTANNNVS